MPFQHKNLADGKWRELSLPEQMGNIGSEINRALLWADRDLKIFENSVFRALELLDLTLQDPRWRGRLKELARARELVCDTFFGGANYQDSFQNVERYFFTFALAARLHH